MIAQQEEKHEQEIFTWASAISTWGTSPNR